MFVCVNEVGESLHNAATDRSILAGCDGPDHRARRRCAGTADAASSSRHHKTQDGIYLSAEQRELHMRTYQPLDSSMMSRDVYLGGKTRVTIKGGPRGTVIEGGAIEAGYQVGYPVSFAPNGITIGMQTPSLSISGGLSAGAPLPPGIPLPLAGGSITPERDDHPADHDDIQR